MIKVCFAKVKKINNSKGVRIAIEFLNALGTNEVILELTNNTLIE